MLDACTGKQSAGVESVPLREANRPSAQHPRQHLFFQGR